MTRCKHGHKLAKGKPTATIFIANSEISTLHSKPIPCPDCLERWGEYLLQHIEELERHCKTHQEKNKQYRHRIDQLERQLAEANDQIRVHQETTEKLLEEAKADSERLDWLDELHHRGLVVIKKHDFHRNEPLREAIDKARNK